MPNEKTERERQYILTGSQLLDLLQSSVELDALTCGGVDNWEWYGESIEDYINDYVTENHLEDKNIEEISQVAEDMLSEYPEYRLFC